MLRYKITIRKTHSSEIIRSDPLSVVRYMVPGFKV